MVSLARAESDKSAEPARPAVAADPSVAAAPPVEPATPPASNDPPAEAPPAGSAIRIIPFSVPAKILRYANQFLKRHDIDRDGQLSEREWSRLPGNPLVADANGDRILSEVELATYITRYGQVRRIRLLSSNVGGDASTESDAAPDASEKPEAGSPDAARRRDTKFFIPSNRLPVGLPTWFSDRDQDGDGQLTMSEFSPNPSPRDLAEFTALDRNGDGLVTAREAVRGPEQPAPPKDAEPKSTKPE